MFQCSECHKALHCKGDLTRHSFYVHRPRVYCPVKDCQSFVKSANFLYHIKACHDAKIIDCRICNKTIDKSSRHYKIKITEQRTILSCENYSQGVIYPNLQQNVKRGISKPKSSTRSANSTKSLQGCFVMKDRNSTKLESKKTFRCNYAGCNRVFLTYGACYMHSRFTHAPKIDCPFGCAKSCRSLYFNKHVQTKHCKNDTFCQICEKVVSKHDVLNHIEFDAFAKKITLVCKKDSKVKSTEELKEKVEYIHTKLKCQLSPCTSSFSTLDDLRSHLDRIHSKAIFCPFEGCSRSYKRRQLVEHVESVHNQFETTCVHCRIKVPPKKSLLHLLENCGRMKGEHLVKFERNNNDTELPEQN